MIAKLRATIASQFGSIGAHSNGVLPKLWTRLYEHTCNVRIPLKTFFLGILRDSFLLLISLMIKLKAEKNRRNCRCSLNQRTPAMFTLFIPRKTPRCAKRYISNKKKKQKSVTHTKPHHCPIFTLLSKSETTVFRHLIFIYPFLPARTTKAQWTRGNPYRLVTNSMSVNIKPEFDKSQSQLENDVTNTLTFIRFPFIARFYYSSVIVKSKKMMNIECGRKIVQ